MKRKASRAKATPGFDSYNAKTETVRDLASYRCPWAEGRRCLLLITGFKERPNRKIAPKEFHGREYRVEVDEPRYGAGIWDRWEHGGETLDSCTLLTVASDGNGPLQAIYHPRCPVLLTETQAVEWMDQGTSPARAYELCQLISGEHLRTELV